MRGKPGDGSYDDTSMRIIPAHAGQTGRFHPHERRRPDHPRACGANKSVRGVSGVRIGSSPRMRGKHHADTTHGVEPRIIPAHAGQTTAFSAAPTPATDHPRACGANMNRMHQKIPYIGSSPRMRGKPGERETSPEARRIIPAHAGQTEGGTCAD